jgi:hypothetical protein
LISYLAAREDSLGGPVLVMNAGEGLDAIQLVLLVPGRNRPWDLGRVGDDLAGLFPDAALDESIVLPFQRADEFFTGDLIPGWAQVSPQWNVWATCPGEGPTSGQWPPGVRRGVWQAAPRLVWSPDQVEEALGWHVDRFCSADQVQPHGPPPVGIPVDFLKMMKALFDPSGALECPEWLEGSDD